jgi:Zn-dependent protease
MQLGTMVYVASTWVLPVLLAVTLHEAAHGFVTHRLGDDTAYRLGRVSFNPLKHIDPFGTILMPAILLFLRSPFLFGYAKPVPVNFRALNHPRRDMVLVAAAGPATNIALATLAALLFPIASYLPPEAGSWMAQNLRTLWSSMSFSPYSTCCRCRRLTGVELPSASFQSFWQTRLPTSNPTG